jgi:hypothetical protein
VTDPTCSLAPTHHLVTSVVERVNSGRGDAGVVRIESPEWIYRPNPA